MSSFPILAVLLFEVSFLFAKSSLPIAFSDKITVVEEAGAPGQIDHEQLGRLYWRLFLGENIRSKLVPEILVFHLSSNAVAGVVGRASGQVEVDRCRLPSGEIYYQLWLFGKPTVREYAFGLLLILEREFRPDLSDGELQELLEGLIPGEDAAADVQALVGHRSKISP